MARKTDRNKWEGRDRKRDKARRGMVVESRSVFVIEAEQRKRARKNRGGK